MKKRKLIDLPKPTLELLARCAAALKPPPAMTLSEWAHRYRVLSAESSAELPGKRRNGGRPAFLGPEATDNLLGQKDGDRIHAGH